MKTGDLIRIGSMCWVVEGEFLGAVGQESVVKLRCVTARPPNGQDGKRVETYVPAAILNAALGRGGAEHYEPSSVTTLPRDTPEASHG